MIASLVVLSLLTVTRGAVPSDPFGTWVLNRVKSDFGTADIPRQMVVRLEQTDQVLSVMTLIIDGAGTRISFRKYDLPSLPRPQANLLSPINSDPMRSEEWQVTPEGELVISRIRAVGHRMTLQRLVFDRSTWVE